MVIVKAITCKFKPFPIYYVKNFCVLQKTTTKTRNIQTHTKTNKHIYTNKDTQVIHDTYMLDFF